MQDAPSTALRFRDGDRILTLSYVEKWIDGYAVGWCPELKNNIVVHPENIVTDGESDD